MSTSLADIERYYDRQQFFYTYLWSRSALHYGLWYPETKTLGEAIGNTDRLVSQLLNIHSGDTVLDAGCGVGGTSLFIAGTTQARVEGITLSQVQLEIARRECMRLGLENHVRFSRQDFCNSAFSDMAFSKIIGIESVSHALEKADFVGEAYRLLGIGGRLGVCDVFLTYDQMPTTHELIYSRFLNGWALPNLVSRHLFSTLLKSAGFDDVVFYDLRELIERSIARIYRHGLLTRPFSILKSLGQSVRRDYPARYQKVLFDEGI